MQDVKRAVTRASFFMGLVVASLLSFSASCGSNPAASGDPGNRPQPSVDPCLTPQKGCPCNTPGETVKCGHTVHGEQNFVYCYEGTRTCQPDGRFGDCLDGVVTARSIQPLTGSSTGVKPLGFGTSMACTAYSDGGTATVGDGGAGTDPGLDPCDPYCHVQHDDPIGIPLGGGFGIVDDGLAVVGSDGGSAAPSEVQTTGSGVSDCGGADNVVAAGSCSATPFQSCQQDHRCDPGTDTCVWNGTDGYYDPNAGGVDLTIGAGCEIGNEQIVPLCNRGSDPVPPDTIIGINIVPNREDGCTASYSTYDCAINVGAAGLAPGKCVNVTGCTIAGNKNAVVNAGQRDIAEAPGRCQNNGAAVKTTGQPGCAVCQACTTTVTGTVFDPSGYSASPGTANNVGLANINIFQPAGALTPLTDNPSTGPGCDTCESLSSPSITSTYTNPDGTFTLTGVTPGPNQTLVVQSGRWRRAFSVGQVNACQDNAIEPGIARLPKNRTDGLGNVADIPRMALVLGAAETLECFLRRVGISDSEFTNGASDYAGAIAKPQRFHVYRSNGWQMEPTPTPSVATLLGSSGPLNAYTAVIGSCDGGGSTAGWRNLTSAEKNRLMAYTDQGGRLFTNHWNADAIFRDGEAPWNSGQVAAHDDPSDTTGNPSARVNNATPPQQMLYDFLRAANAMTTHGEPYIDLRDPRFQFSAAGTNAIEWIRGLEPTATSPTSAWTTTPAGTHAMSISFETPLGAAADSTCGRVIFNGMHVSQARAPLSGSLIPNTQRFPTNCLNAGMAPTPEELALEFQLFQLTACALNPPPGAASPVPAPLAVLSTYAVEFNDSVCNPGERPVWQLFQYKANVPAGTAIIFRAATSDDPTQLPGNVGPTATPPGAPTTVQIGTALDANAFTNTDGWTYDSHGASPPAGFQPYDPRPISWHLANDVTPGQSSKSYLRVYITFQTNGNVSPVLYEWRQLFSCVPAE